MTIRELYEKLGEYVELEGDKEVAVKVMMKEVSIRVMMEDYSTFNISLYNDGDWLGIEID